MDNSFNEQLDLKSLPQFLIRFKINIFSTNATLIENLISKLGKTKKNPILRISKTDETNETIIMNSSTQIVSFIYSSFQNAKNKRCIVSYTKTVLNSNSIKQDDSQIVLYLSNLILFIIDKSNEESLELITQYYKSIFERKKRNYFLITTTSEDNDEISEEEIEAFQKELPPNSQRFDIELEKEKTLIPLKEQLDKLFFIENTNDEQYNNSFQMFLNFNRHLFFSSEKETTDLSSAHYPKINVLLIGNSKVGKTCFCHQLFTDRFFESISTIGIEFRQLIVKIKDTKCKISIWDTGGQERFKNTLFTSFQKVDAFLLFFSLDDYQSFEDVQNWFESIKNFRGEKFDQENVPLILIGNKWDLHDKRKVSYSDAATIANKYDVPYIEVSSMTGLNVQETLISILCLSQKILLDKEELQTFSLNKHKLQQTQKKKCCK